MTYTSAMQASRKTTITPVGVVGKVLRILELLDRTPAGLQLKDIARLTSLNKSTASFSQALGGEGYLFRDDSGSYRVGPRLVDSGTASRIRQCQSRISRPVLEELWTTTGGTVNLATLVGQVLYVDVMEACIPSGWFSQIGSRRPLSCTALGRRC